MSICPCISSSFTSRFIRNSSVLLSVSPLSVCLSDCLHVFVYVCLSICLLSDCLCVFVCLCLSLNLSVIWMSLSLYVCLSLCLCICQPKNFVCKTCVSSHSFSLTVWHWLCLNLSIFHHLFKDFLLCPIMSLFLLSLSLSLFSLSLKMFLLYRGGDCQNILKTFSK